MTLWRADVELATWVTPVDIAAGIALVVLLLAIIPLTWFADRNKWK